MAESLDTNIEDDTLVSGSEPVYDFFCEICRENGQYLEAMGFCVDCGDYLCIACLGCHKRTRLTINHVVLDRHNMPKDKPLSYDTCNRVIETKCKLHLEETLRYYCKKHDSLLCGICMNADHTRCPTLENIRELSERFEQSHEYQTFEGNLKRITQRSSHIIQQCRDNIRQVQHNCNENLQAIRQQREQVNKLLDTLENNFKTQAETIKSDNIKEIEAVSKKVNAISIVVQQIISKVRRLQKSKKLCELYITMKESSSCEIQGMNLDLDGIGNKYHANVCAFEPSVKLKEICKNVSVFGRICLQQRDQISVTGALGDPTTTKATRMPDIELRSATKLSRFDLRGSAVLSGNQMVVVDSGNDTVSLLDTQANKLIHDLNVPKWPWDVCAIGRNHTAVTIPNHHKIILLKATHVLSVEREITVNGNCYGIAHSRGRLIVTFMCPPRVEIIDLRGKVIKKIENDRHGNTLFQLPLYVCISSDEESIYISDHHANKVICLTHRGDVWSDYTDRELSRPYKVCCDDRSYVYVASHSNNTIHMLTSDCSRVKILLTEADGLTGGVLSISHCRETNKLFVGMNSSRIKVFQIQ